MKILGRIKKSKVLTAVMTAVLIFQSACPTGLAYAAQKSGVSAYAAGQTIDQALGATKTVESVLSQHENDEYYLTTPYGNKGPHGEGGAIDTWDCWKPKGEYAPVLWLPSSVPVERIHPSSETIPPRTATTGVTRRTHLNGMSIAATTMPSATHSAPKSRCSRPVSLRRAISSTWSRRTGIIAIQTAISASSGAATARKTFSGTLPATRTEL